MDSQNSTDHPDNLLVPYLEDALGPEDRARVEAHLRECAACSAALANLKETVELLKRNKSALCPTPEQLYLMSRNESVSPEMSNHVRMCAACRQDLAALTVESEPMPNDLWLKIKQKFPDPAPEKQDLPAVGFFEKLAGLLRPRLVTASAFAAAILVLILVWPAQKNDFEVGLSSVAWQDTMKPKTFLPKMAFVIVHKKNEEIRPARIDSLYEALQPPMQLSNYYEIVSPAALNEAVVSKSIDTSDIGELLEQLKKYLNISETILITISDQGGTNGFKVERVDNSSRRVSASSKKNGIAGTNLNNEIRSAVLGLITPKEQ